jgi:hypothetical protein
MQIRNRIKELRFVRAADLLVNPRNWRRHPKAQSDALRALLSKIGYAGAVLARELPDGQLMLIDGHLRVATTPDALIPVLVLDVTEQEADEILATFDPLGAMAEADSERLEALLETMHPDDEALLELLRRTAGNKLWEALHPLDLNEAEVSPDRAHELEAKWRTERGQVWRCEPHKLICGDSTDPTVLARLWSDTSATSRK